MYGPASDTSLVTPFSQYVKNLAMMNVMQMEKRQRTLGYDCVRHMGYDIAVSRKAARKRLRLEIVEKAKAEGRQFFGGDPQKNYPDALDKYRKLMNESNGVWAKTMKSCLSTLCIRAEYEAYRSGKAQVEFLADVASRKAALHEAQAPQPHRYIRHCHLLLKQ